MADLLLLSGGLDSVAIASILRPDHSLFVDYGQVTANGERSAARFAAGSLDLALSEFRADLSSLGSGLLVGEDGTNDGRPSQEWFPYRNQFLATVASAAALQLGCDRVVIGIVADDSHRHVDGSQDFVRALSHVVAMQEGGITIDAPFIGDSGNQLLREAALPRELLYRTFSCHRSSLACGYCPGCARRRQALAVISNRPSPSI